MEKKTSSHFAFTSKFSIIDSLGELFNVSFDYCNTNQK